MNSRLVAQALTRFQNTRARAERNAHLDWQRVKKAHEELQAAFAAEVAREDAKKD